MNRYQQAVKLENMADRQAEALSKIISRCQVQVDGFHAEGEETVIQTQDSPALVSLMRSNLI